MKPARRVVRVCLLAWLVLGLPALPSRAQEAVQAESSDMPTGQPESPSRGPGGCPLSEAQPAASSSGRPARPTPKPGPANALAPLLCRPFSGEYNTAGFFDHEVPVLGDDNGYALTWWGVRVWPTSDGHAGYDWQLPDATPVLAAASGVVVFAGLSDPSPCRLLGRDVSNSFVSIDHEVTTADQTLRIRSSYSHLTRIDVEVGQLVEAGDPLGLVGTIGCSQSSHLHFDTNLLTGRRAIPLDPFGWDGPGPDPWAQHAEGTQSFWLWQEDQAPAISYIDIDAAPNPTGTVDRGAPVAITYVRWLVPHAERNPNAEFVELTLDARYAPTGSYDLTGHVLRNLRGDSFEFPGGFRIHDGAVVRIFLGSGQGTQTTLYWGRTGPVWNPMGDCIRLVAPNGSDRYRLWMPGGACN